MARNLFGGEGCFPQTTGDTQDEYDARDSSRSVVSAERRHLPDDQFAALSRNAATHEADADKLDIPIHAFDLIIADECHRGYTAQEMAQARGQVDQPTPSLLAHAFAGKLGPQDPPRRTSGEIVGTHQIKP